MYKGFVPRTKTGVGAVFEAKTSVKEGLHGSLRGSDGLPWPRRDGVLAWSLFATRRSRLGLADVLRLVPWHAGEICMLGQGRERACWWALQRAMLK